MRKLFTFLIALLMVICFVFPASAAWRDMWATVYKMNNKTGTDELKLVPITSGITFKVLARNADTAETLYYYGKDSFTSLTNPVSTTNFASATVMKSAGVLSFRVDPTDSTSDTYVDLIVVDTATGFTAFVEDFDAETHKIVIDERPNIVHSAMMWFDVATSTETDTGINFLPDTQILTMWLEVVTTDTGETLSVGVLSSQTGGDADGFIATGSVATAGHVLPTLANSGDLLDDGTNFDVNGEIIDGVTYVSGAVGGASMSITGSAGIDTADGYIHYLLTRIR